LPGRSAENPYQTIWKDLRVQIEGGVYKPGDRLPSEKSLVRRYGHSRVTVRRALRELAQEGFIEAKQGRGTFVLRSKPRWKKRLGELASFTRQLEGSGFCPQSRLLCKELLPLEEVERWVAEAFGLAEGEHVVHIRRLRSGDGLPFAVQSVYLLPARCPGILEQDFTSLFKLYEERYGVLITEAEEVLRVARASEEEAALLEIAPGDPVVIRQRISLDQRGCVFEVLRSVDRSDRFEYHYHIALDETKAVL